MRSGALDGGSERVIPETGSERPERQRLLGSGVELVTMWSRAERMEPGRVMPEAGVAAPKRM